MLFILTVWKKYTTYVLKCDWYSKFIIVTISLIHDNHNSRICIHNERDYSRICTNESR